MMPQPDFGTREHSAALRLIAVALEEDEAWFDRTSEVSLESGEQGAAVLRAREQGVVAGLPCIALTLTALGSDVQCDLRARDGDPVTKGTQLARLRGNLASLLTAERTFLNLVGLLSGTASLTRRFVEAAGERCAVLDTRKTWPGGRVLQKYAVRCGGGRNHRMGLSDAILLKDNHRSQAGGIPRAVATARRLHPELPVIVEVDDLQQLEEALGLGIDRVLLDNFEPDGIRQAVERRDALAAGVLLEVSGGVTLERVGALAAAGADMVSVGALTHSAPALDVGLDLESS